MIDAAGRVIDYMRISITDRCNLRCRYCMPDGITQVSMAEILTYEEIRKVCILAAELGIQKIMARKHQKLPMCANVDLYSGLIYNMLDLPEDLYTPLFATARIAGWCAHRMEEVVTGNRIMRPAYRAAVEHRAYVPMEKRQ